MDDFYAARSGPIPPLPWPTIPPPFSVWRAEINGRRSEPITQSEVDVEDFRLDSDGQTLIYSARPALATAYAAIANEAISGFHYDDRYVPLSRSRPYPAAPVPRVVFAQDIETGMLRKASEGEASQLPVSPVAETSWHDSRTPDGRRAWLAVPSTTFYPSLGRLTADDAHGQPVTCADVACENVSRPWWTAAGRVRFFRREGWADGSTAIYEWTPGADAPRRLYVTDDVLVDCEPSGDELLCLREGSLTPRRLERLDPSTGQRHIVFDPNPEFAGLTLGRAERLHLSPPYSSGVS